MLEPTIIASMAANILSNLAKEEIAKKLTSRLTEAKKQHAEVFMSDPEHPLEKLRDDNLHRLCSLQQEIVLCVSDPEFLSRVLPLSLDLISNTYEAKTENELEILGMGISRLEGALGAYKNEKSRRKWIRLFAVIVSLLSLVGIGVFLWFSQGIYNETTHLVILMLPLPVILWSIIGSFAAILYRFTKAGDNELNEPLKWLFARPLSGVVMGAIAYLIMRVGLISINADAAAPLLGTSEAMWLLAFLAGFSDRFSDYLLKTVVGKYGGSTEGDLITLEMSNKTTSTETGKFPILNHLLPNFMKRNSGTGNPAELTNGTNANPPSNANPSANGTAAVAPANVEKQVTTTNESEIKLTASKEDISKN
jgi:hypothetical protein